jgi:hypothetical protein
MMQQVAPYLKPRRALARKVDAAHFGDAACRLVAVERLEAHGGAADLEPGVQARGLRALNRRVDGAAPPHRAPRAACRRPGLRLQRCAQRPVNTWLVFRRLKARYPSPYRVAHGACNALRRACPVGAARVRGAVCSEGRAYCGAQKVLVGRASDVACPARRRRRRDAALVLRACRAPAHRRPVVPQLQRCGPCSAPGTSNHPPPTHTHIQYEGECAGFAQTTRTASTSMTGNRACSSHAPGCRRRT